MISYGIIPLPSEIISKTLFFLLRFKYGQRSKNNNVYLTTIQSVF